MQFDLVCYYIEVYIEVTPPEDCMEVYSGTLAVKFARPQFKAGNQFRRCKVTIGSPQSNCQSPAKEYCQNLLFLNILDCPKDRHQSIRRAATVQLILGDGVGTGVLILQGSTSISFRYYAKIRNPVNLGNGIPQR